MSIVSNWVQTIKNEIYVPSRNRDPSIEQSEEFIDTKEVTTVTQEEQAEANGLGKYWTIIAAGAGLFSDGYVNNVSYKDLLIHKLYMYCFC